MLSIIPVHSRLLCLLIPALCHPAWLAADVIYLKNGKRLSVQKAWEDGDKVRYEKGGNLFGFPKKLVDRIELGESIEERPLNGISAIENHNSVKIEVLEERLDLGPSFVSEASPVVGPGGIDFDLLAEFEREAEGHPRNRAYREQYLAALGNVIEFQIRQGELNAAAGNLHRYLQFDPEELQAYLALGSIYIRQGQYQQAVSTLATAEVQNGTSPDLHYLLGSAYYFLEKNDLAKRHLSRSLELRYKREVEELLRKIEGENRAETAYKQANSLHFVIRYEGTETNQHLSQEILASLERSFGEMEATLNYSPRETIAVILYPDAVFQDVTRTPNWVGALNDGKIRVPIKGLTQVDTRLQQILKHELTHSFLRLKTRGNCPVWLNEGLAQFLTGESARGQLHAFKEAAAQNKLPQLHLLEGSFMTLPAPLVPWAYRQSLLVTELLVQNYGMGDIERLLTAAAINPSFEAALKQVLRRDYADLQNELYEFIARQ
ncbi:MAG: tetratricopeptide repeat protein [Acidobacteriota bacterium]